MVKKDVNYRNITKTLIIMTFIILIMLILFFNVPSYTFSEKTIIMEGTLNNKIPVCFSETSNGLLYAVLDNQIAVYFVESGESISRKIYASGKTVSYSNVKAFKDSMISLEVSFDENKGAEFYLNYIKSDSYKTLFKGNCDKMPYFYIVGENLLFVYNHKGMSSLIAINTNDESVELIENTEYSVNQEGKYTGEVILYAGGYEDNVYYEKIQLENQYLEESLEANIVRYSLKKKKIMHEYQLKRKTLHISGASKFILVSEYDYGHPIEDSGKIFSLTPNTLQERLLILDVNSGNDIVDSYVINENIIMFLTPKCGYVYSYNVNKLYKKEFIGKGNPIVAVGIENGKFVYCEDANGKFLIHFIECSLKEDVFMNWLKIGFIIIVILIIGLCIYRSNVKGLNSNIDIDKQSSNDLVSINNFKETNNSPYLKEITKETITKDGREFIVEDMPKNDYEKVVCNYYLAEMTNDYNNWDKLISDKNKDGIKGQDFIKNEKKFYDEGKGNKKLTIISLETLDKNMIKKDKDLNDRIVFFPGNTYEEQAKELGIEKYVIVKVEIDEVSMDNYVPGQYPVGKSKRFFILALDKDSNPSIYAISYR